LKPGPTVSAADIRAGNDDGGVAVAKRRKLLVVDRDMLSVGLRRWSVALVPVREVS
jgi:hypothetical protein